MNFLLAQLPPNKKPICPTFITDERTGVLVAATVLVISTFILYRIMRYYGR